MKSSYRRRRTWIRSRLQIFLRDRDSVDLSPHLDILIVFVFQVEEDIEKAWEAVIDTRYPIYIDISSENI